MGTTVKPTAIVRTPMALKDIFTQIKGLKVSSLIFSSPSNYRIDNFIFTLHANITVSILTVFMVFVGMRQYFGEPIECMNTITGSSTLTHAQLQHYCWMEGAFTIVNRHIGSNDMKEIAGIDNLYPGVKDYNPNKGDTKVLHKYYQWVYYIVCIQCLLFYAPKHIWRMKEGGRLRALVKKLSSKNVLQYSGLDRYTLVKDTLYTILTANEYFTWIVFSEVLFLIHLIGEILFIHAFLGGKFLSLGFRWIDYAFSSETYTHDPLIRLFPRLTKCSFHKFGVSGSIETSDTLCFMSLNIVHEKIFVGLWFWFVFLFLTTIHHIFFYRACYIMLPWFRRKRLRAIAPTSDKGFIKKISKSPAKCFIIQTIASNMNSADVPDLFQQLLDDHFNTKTYKVESKIQLRDFIVGDKVPESTLQATAPLVKPTPPSPGFKKETPSSDGKDERKSSDSGLDKDDPWTNNDDGWGNVNDAWENAATSAGAQNDGWD